MTDIKITNLMNTLDVTRKGAERVSEIVNAGAGLLLEEGFSGLTKRRIATRLGISHGNVSYYFPTRELLWHAVIEIELKEYYQRHQGELHADPNDPQAQFDEFVVGWIDEYNELERRVLEVMVVLEGLHAVSAFRPELIERNYEFKQRVLRRVNAIIRGE